ncbi:MAG: class I SAM-dependent methyltransferase, partial [Planctomycetota bacterium]
MSGGSDGCATALYETLARYQWWRRWWSRAAVGEGLELRKRLRAPTRRDALDANDRPSDGAAGLDVWLRSKLAGRPSARVLDLGCGFGVSLLRWLEAGAASGVGITSSAFQAKRAAREAERRQLQRRCRFVHQDYAVAVPGPFDVVLAIESLGHARDLAAVLHAVHRVLAPGGIFLLVDDALRAACASDPDREELARRWASPPLREAATVRLALGNAGL